MSNHIGDLKPDPRNARRHNPRAKPYPKRAESVVSDAPAIHAEEGGSIPTSALQVSSDVAPFAEVVDA